MHRVKFTIACAILLGLALPAVSTPIPVGIGDWYGSRSVGSGVTAAGEWATSGFNVRWAIDPAPGGLLRYQYWFTNDAGAPLTANVKAGLSHWIFEVSPDFGTAVFIPDGWGYEGPKDWTEATGNPGMPAAGVFGIKPSIDGGYYSFLTNRKPIWGDFYAKDGGGVYAYNTGFGTEPAAGGPFTNWIAVPDTDTFTRIPEPGTLGLVGGGLLGMGWLVRRRRRKT
jgi:hypothetical protein